MSHGFVVAANFNASDKNESSLSILKSLTADLYYHIGNALSFLLFATERVRALRGAPDSELGYVDRFLMFNFDYLLVLLNHLARDFNRLKWRINWHSTYTYVTLKRRDGGCTTMTAGGRNLTGCTTTYCEIAYMHFIQ